MTPQRVAETSSKQGGKCDHCGERIIAGQLIVKLTPQCCEQHEIRWWFSTANGAGSWVCLDCAEELSPPPDTLFAALT